MRGTDFFNIMLSTETIIKVIHYMDIIGKIGSGVALIYIIMMILIYIMFVYREKQIVSVPLFI